MISFTKKELTQFVFENITLEISNYEKSFLSKYLIDDITINGTSLDKTYLTSLIERINANEPLQYITGVAHFLDYNYYVDKRVLIPRPETEELVVKAITLIETFDCKSILEVGVGSGCISVSLKNKMPQLHITAIDVSQDAIEVAKINSQRYNAEINIQLVDFIDKGEWNKLGHYDVLISNPPYISRSEIPSMTENVLKYEPHVALFPGEDPLLFYKYIAEYAKAYSIPVVLCELNEYCYKDIRDVFINSNFNRVELIDDLQGKCRIIVALDK